MPDRVVIRPAVTSDLARMQGIEVAAGAMFRPLGMDLVADDDPFTVDELRAYVASHPETIVLCGHDPWEWEARSGEIVAT